MVLWGSVLQPVILYIVFWGERLESVTSGNGVNTHIVWKFHGKLETEGGFFKKQNWILFYYISSDTFAMYQYISYYIDDSW